MFTNCNNLNSLHSAKHNKKIILYDVGLFPSTTVNKKAYLSDLLHSKQVSAIQNFVDNFYSKIYQKDIWYYRHTCSSTCITNSLIYLYGHLPCIFIQYGGLNLWSRPTQTTKASTYTTTRYMVSMVDSSKKKSKNTNYNTLLPVKRMYVKRMYLHLLATFIKFGHFNSLFLMIALYVITVRHKLYLFEVVHHYTHPSMSFLKSAENCLINSMIHKK